MKPSEKQWHNNIQLLCNYKRGKKILDMKYGPIVTNDTLTLWKNQEINIDEIQYLSTEQAI